MNSVAYIRRNILGMTQQELAKRLGRSQSAVARWEKSGLFPTEVLPMVRKIASQHPDWSDSLFFEAPATIKAIEAAE